MIEITVQTVSEGVMREPDTARWGRLVAEARELRCIPHSVADELMLALDSAVEMIREHDRAVDEMTDPQREQLELADLRSALSRMTARAEKWRDAHMERSGADARASVAGFSEFCAGHKAGRKQSR
jgi:hypothetical protein